MSKSTLVQNQKLKFIGNRQLQTEQKSRIDLNLVTILLAIPGFYLINFHVNFKNVFLSWVG